MSKEKLYTITCNRKQLELISQACDLISRIQCLQFDKIVDIIQPNNPKKLFPFQDDLLKLKEYFGLSSSFCYGIFSDKVQKSAKILWDIHQVIRRHIAYEDNPGVTPENRWKKYKITVDFDDVYKSDKENELIKVE